VADYRERGVAASEGDFPEGLRSCRLPVEVQAGFGRDAVALRSQELGPDRLRLVGAPPAPDQATSSTEAIRVRTMGHPAWRRVVERARTISRQGRMSACRLQWISPLGWRSPQPRIASPSIRIPGWQGFAWRGLRSGRKPRRSATQRRCKVLGET